LEISRDFYPRYVPELELELAALGLEEGDSDFACQLLDRVLKHVQQAGMEGTLAKADRLRGRLAVLNGDLLAAEDAFVASLDRFETLHQVVEAARTRQAWAETLLPHEAARAQALLDSAMSVFTAAEAWPEVEAIHRLL